MRISLLVGFLGVAFSGALGIGLGLVAGYFGGTVDSLIMRIADVQLTFPAILIALLVDGVAKPCWARTWTPATALGPGLLHRP